MTIDTQLTSIGDQATANLADQQAARQAGADSRTLAALGTRHKAFQAQSLALERTRPVVRAGHDALVGVLGPAVLCAAAAGAYHYRVHKRQQRAVVRARSNQR